MEVVDYLLGKKAGSGGGGSGTSDYTQLTNLPSINGITLTGNKTSGDLGLNPVYKITTNELDLLNLKKGVYTLDVTAKNNVSLNVYYSPNREGNTYYNFSLSFGTLYIFEDITDNMTVGTAIGSYVSVATGVCRIYTLKIRADASGVESNSIEVLPYVDNSTQTISGTKTFAKIPKQSNTNAPTDNAEFTNKKYVDDSIASAITDALGGSY